MVVIVIVPNIRLELFQANPRSTTLTRSPLSGAALALDAIAMDGDYGQQPVIDIPSLPDISKAEVVFPETSFFKSDDSSETTRLPTPAEIHRQYPKLDFGVAKFESLNLAVKVAHKSRLRLEEAQAMVAIHPAGVSKWPSSSARSFWLEAAQRDDLHLHELCTGEDTGWCLAFLDKT